MTVTHSPKLAIVWFRNDLRLSDNPALSHAMRLGTIIPIYILDDINNGPYKNGSANRVWRHHSLIALNDSLSGQLRVFKGDTLHAFKYLAGTQSITDICWNRATDPWQQAIDATIESWAKSHRIHSHTFNGTTIWDPTSIYQKDGQPFRVFTPFFRKGCLNQPLPTPIPPKQQPRILPVSPSTDSPHDHGPVSIDALGLLPTTSNWHRPLMSHWQPGEAGATAALASFMDHGLDDYKDTRNYPGKAGVSRLSPHIHFGELSVRAIWHQIEQHPPSRHTRHFLSELGWREFSYYLLAHWPDLPSTPLQSFFNDMPWTGPSSLFDAWTRGQTGYPMVDAGMRELWQTGYMHNRSRMITAAFLVKYLGLDWRKGWAWFWDCLVDADMANNSAGWQWAAGCGTDNPTNIRFFNPIDHARWFDPEGHYIHRYLPELAALSPPYLFDPSSAPATVLADAGIVLGRDYPMPIIDLQDAESRTRQIWSQYNPNLATG